MTEAASPAPQPLEIRGKPRPVKRFSKRTLMVLIGTGSAIMLITHDLGVVAGLCDRVAVMYAGQIVETGPAEEVFHRPAHPYTQGLIRSTPRLDDRMERLVAIEGAPPNLLSPPAGCAFRARCPIAEPVCEAQPALTAVEGRPGGTVACWRAATDAWSTTQAVDAGMLRAV